MIAVILLVITVVVLGVAMLFGIDTKIPLLEVMIACIVFVIFFVAGVHIAAALGVFGLLIGLIYSDRPFWIFSGEVFWSISSNFIFVAVPLFLLMGEILLRS